MTDFSKSRTIGLWVLRLVLAAAFLAAGGAKLAGAQPMVEIFDKIGLGQWFRFVTGTLEVGGAILLLLPSQTFYGAALLLLVMVGAVTAHLTVLGGNPAPALILLVLSVTTSWLTRHTLRKPDDQDYPPSTHRKTNGDHLSNCWQYTEADFLSLPGAAS